MHSRAKVRGVDKCELAGKRIVVCERHKGSCYTCTRKALVWPVGVENPLVYCGGCDVKIAKSELLTHTKGRMHRAKLSQGGVDVDCARTKKGLSVPLGETDVLAVYLG